jgi:hypothetical protein
VKKRTLFLSFLLTLISVFVLAACNREGTEVTDPTVVDPISFSVTLNSSSKSLVQGDSFILVATLDGITDYDSIGWAADGNLVQITPSGLNAVINAGTETGVETITVTVTKGGVSQTATCEVTVNTISLELTLDTENITLSQGQSVDVTLAINPVKTETVVTWIEDGTLLDIVVNGNVASLTAGADTGTTTVTVTASVFGETFEKEIQITVNEIVPFVDIQSSVADVNVGDEIEISLDFLTAYQASKDWSISYSSEEFVSAVVNNEDKLVITGLEEGQITLTLTMTTNDNTYSDTITVNVRPLGYLSVSGNVYDPFDMQLNFTESTYFSDIDEEIWQQYNIILGAGTNTGQGDRRGQFVFAMHHSFVKDGDKDVIQVMANGMSAIAVKIPDNIENDNLAAFEFSMKLAELDPSFGGTWTLRFLIANVADGKTTLYAVDNADNNGVQIGSLTISNQDLKREGYHNYTFFVNQLPESAGNYIVMYFGNTNNFNGIEGNRTYIDGFNFLSKEMTGIALTTPANDLEYVVGQSFDPTGMVVSAIYTVGNNLPIHHDDLTLDYDFTTPGVKTVTVSYGDYEIDFEVTVVERAITALELTSMPSKVIYTDGETFDPAGMVVNAIFNDDSTEVVTEYTFDESPLEAGMTSMTITYADVSVEVAITVNTAALESIAVTTQPTKVEYVVGQQANFSGIVVTATYADTSTGVIPFSALVFSGFNSAMVEEDQVITVSYGGQSTTFTVDIIEKVAAGIEIVSYPQVTYFIGDDSNWSGLVVELVYNDNSKEAVDFEDLTITGFDSTVAGQVEIVITYLTFDKAFNIMITDDEGYEEVLTQDMNFVKEGLVANSTMYTDLFTGETPADREDYDVLLGRTLNDDQRSLQYSEAIYFSGEGAEAIIVVQTNGMSAMAVRIPDGLSAADITAFSFSMSGEHITTLADTITFRPSFRFSSMADGVEYFHTTDRGDYYLPQSGSLTITQPDFTRTGYHDYTVRINTPELPENVSLGNYLLIYMGNNGSFRDSTNTSLYLNGFKFWTRDVVTNMTMTSEPTQTNYEVDEAFNPAGLVVTPLYGVNLYNAPSTISYSNLTFDYDFSTVGEKVVVVSYGELSFEINVTVSQKVMTSLEVTTAPDKVEYNSGETFDPTGMVITALFDNETSEVVTEYTVDTETPLVAGATYVEVSYEGLTVQVPITVSSATLESIEVTQMPQKVEYVVGQDADYTNLVVTANYSDLSTNEIAFESLVITGFDSSVPEVGQVITVTFGEESTTFLIDIVEKEITSILIQTLPKTNYVIDELADWTGLNVLAVFNDDSTEPIDIEDLVITGFDSSVEGDVTITITYQTFDTSFDITVSEDVVTDYTEVLTQDMNFVTDGLVANTTLYTDLFSGESPADRSDYDVLLGRAQNVAERPLQYSTLIYFDGEGTEAILIVQTNGLATLAVRIPDGLSAEDITAFSFSMSGEHITTLADTVTFSPSFRFSSVFDGIEYFHPQANGTYALGQSGATSVTQPDFTRTGYHDYTVEITQPSLSEGLTIGNYLIMYMGNNGSFRDSTSTSLHINGFKFWTKDVVTDATLTAQPSKTTYEVGETFDPTGLIVTPTYGVDIHNAPTEVNHNDLTFTYDFSVAGETTVTVEYLSYILNIPVTVVEPTEP